MKEFVDNEIKKDMIKWVYETYGEEVAKQYERDIINT